MANCQKCGAALTAGATVCSYCGSATHLAHDLVRQAHVQQQQLAYQQHQAQLHREVARQHEAQASIKRTAMHSLIWSLLGLFCCLIPVFGVVGIVMALRARRMAKEYGLVIPATATLGMVMGAFALVASALAYTMVIVQELQRANRIDELEERIRAPATADALSSSTACDLAELSLLKDGIAGHSGSNLEGFECVGQLSQAATRAELDDYSFVLSNQRRHVRVCYKRGLRWAIVGFRVSATCAGPEDLASLRALASSNAGAAPSGSTEAPPP